MVDMELSSAVEDFRRARRQAALEEVMARLTGRSNQLLSFDEVQRKVGARGQIDRGLQDIPLDAIVGSVGRYGDFTRTFLPRKNSMEGRWARVKTVATGMKGWPPIELYQIGDAYFVQDGNHRVSIARQMGLETIPAYVTEVKSKVPLSASVDPDELIIKSEYVDFQHDTNLGRSRPDADLAVTAPGAYQKLFEHIAVHRYYMGLEQDREIPYTDAAEHWYDSVYLPVVYAIRERGLLYEFPDRTETDLYLWLTEHRSELEEELGWEVSAESVAHHLSSEHGSQQRLTRVGSRLRSAFTPADLAPGPAAGEWRARRLLNRYSEQLFPEIMVALTGEAAGWEALEQAIILAQREEARLRALHVVPEGAETESDAIAAIRDRFQWRLGEAELSGKLVVEAGAVVQKIVDRARWNDLVVLPLLHPPGIGFLERLGSEFRMIVQRCARPLLAVPGAAAPLRRALLAYDDSEKAREALFVAAYLAERREVELVVAMVNEDEATADALRRTVETYLEIHEVVATYDTRTGEPASSLVAAAEEHDCDFLIVGGYAARPVIEIAVGGVLDQLLRVAQKPVLICR